MKSMQQPAPGSADGEWWAVMQPVFDLGEDADAARPRPGSARRA
jgi:hypothetical protein